MVKTTVINAELCRAMVEARHGDAIVLCDGNMPIPPKCSIIDLSLTRGVPTMMQVMKAVLNDMVAERYDLFSLMPEYNPGMAKAIQSLLNPLPGGTVDQRELTEIMLRAKAVVRTGDMGTAVAWYYILLQGWRSMWSGLHLVFQKNRRSKGWKRTIVLWWSKTEKVALSLIESQDW